MDKSIVFYTHAFINRRRGKNHEQSHKPKAARKEKLTLWIVVASNWQAIRKRKAIHTRGKVNLRHHDLRLCKRQRARRDTSTCMVQQNTQITLTTNFQPCPNGFLMGARTYMPGDTTASQASLQAREDQVLTARLTAEKGHSTTHQYP